MAYKYKLMKVSVFY